MKLNRKLLIPLGTLTVIAAPIAVVASCSKESTTEENAKAESLKNVPDLVIQDYVQKVNKDSFGAEYAKAEEDAWNFWASQKLMKEPLYWKNKVSDLIKQGAITKADVVNKVWVDAQTGKDKSTKPATVIKIERNTYPSWKTAQDIMKNNPSLLWSLEINKLLLVEDSLTKTTPQILKNMFKGKKEENLPKNLMTLENWKKTIDENEKSLPSDNDLKYFYLTKYLKENTPTLVWKKEISDVMWVTYYGQREDKVSDVDSFNNIGSEKKKSILENNYVGQNSLKATEELVTKNNFDANKLEGSLGISKPGISKGDLDYSEWGLKKRLKGSKSKAGFVNKDGEIKADAEIIIKDGKATVEFVRQFLPWLDAKDKDGKEIVDKAKVSSINNDKSIFRLDSKLIDKNEKENLRKLIFTLATKDSSLFTDAKKILLIGKGKSITTDNEELKDKLDSEGFIK
ncbi:HinT-interacting membrane complex lipoprotein P60 [Mycoplasma marinum]|uniref:Uncharacterized protein n=1 Tax=Mycoplasma marinum TaxID=1937190 RepID=A0A4R0XT43_9MOLU|nr:hypothetical protein [Mycoplasma marinum]TCG10907.1 hypothetical protein C4B24_03545 [Mycoplasma marinum]